jgi:hypothetical protein
VKIAQHISGAVVALLVLSPFALLVEPNPVLSYTRNYSSLDVQPGEIVSVTATIERASACSSRVYRQWIDVQGNTIGDIAVEHIRDLPAGEVDYFAQFKIPETVLPGPLRYRVKTTFYCNFLQRVFGIGADFVMPDVIFTVRSTGEAYNG